MYGGKKPVDLCIDLAKAPGRRFPGRKPPVVRRQRKELVLDEIGLDLQRRAELARLHRAHQLLDRRLEALLVPHRERHAALVARRNRLQNIGAGERQRLLAKDVLTIWSVCRVCGVQSTRPLCPCRGVMKRRDGRVELRLETTGCPKKPAGENRPEARRGPAAKYLSSRASLDDKSPSNESRRVGSASGHTNDAISKSLTNGLNAMRRQGPA